LQTQVSGSLLVISIYYIREVESALSALYLSIAELLSRVEDPYGRLEDLMEGAT
jgi:hypothetical protein